MNMHDPTSPPLIRPLPIRRFCTVAVMLVVYMQAPADAIAGLVVTTGGIDYYISDHNTDIDDAAAAAATGGFGTGWLIRALDSPAANADIISLTAAATPAEVFGHEQDLIPHYLLRSLGDDTELFEQVHYRESYGSNFAAYEWYHTIFGPTLALDTLQTGHWVLTRTSSGAVPEPSTFLCFCLVGLAFGGWRKLKKSDS